MYYMYIYNSKLGNIYLLSDGIYLTGLSFNKYNYKIKDLPIFKDTIKWLDLYFNGYIPDFELPIKLENISLFTKQVLSILKDVSYGTTITYNELSKKVATLRGLDKMAAQAVGSALGKNPIAIIIPCHRVVGKNNKLIGYHWGIERKKKLLEIEGNIYE